VQGWRLSWTGQPLGVALSRCLWRITLDKTQRQNAFDGFPLRRREKLPGGDRDPDISGAGRCPPVDLLRRDMDIIKRSPRGYFLTLPHYRGYRGLDACPRGSKSARPLPL